MLTPLFFFLLFPLFSLFSLLFSCFPLFVFSLFFGPLRLSFVCLSLMLDYTALIHYELHVHVAALEILIGNPIDSCGSHVSIIVVVFGVINWHPGRIRMGVYTCACAYECMFIRMRVHTCAYVYMCVCIRVRMHTCARACM